MSTRLNRPVVRKTASFTVTPPQDKSGTLFTNGGAAGAITATLPNTNAGMLGYWVGFLGLVDQLITIATQTSDTLVGFNDVDLDSIALGASGQRIGAYVEVCVVEVTAGVYRWAVVQASTNGVTFATVD